MDADDLLIESCLENRLKKIKENNDGNLFVFAMGVFHKKIGDDDRNWIPKSKQPLNDFLQHQLPWSILQPIWSKNFLLKIGGFDENYTRLQDVELHTRALLNPAIKYYQFPEIVDCYYRIDEERKSLSPFVFLNRWMSSSCMYCNKYENIVPKHLKKFLYGTILKSYQQIIYHLRKQHINKKEFNELQNVLFSCTMYSHANRLKKFFFKLSYIYNLKMGRIPGVNKTLLHLIMN